MMIGSLAISPAQPLARNDAQCRMAVLGLGGGLLAAYLVRHFKKVSDFLEIITIIEKFEKSAGKKFQKIDGISAENVKFQYVFLFNF